MTKEIDDLHKIIKCLEVQQYDTKELLNKLIGYLERTDNNFNYDDDAYISWQDRLTTMQVEEQHQLRINEAKKFLKRSGYIVVENENEIDAQRLKHWVTHKDEET